MVIIKSVSHNSYNLIYPYLILLKIMNSSFQLIIFFCFISFHISFTLSNVKHQRYLNYNLLSSRLQCNHDDDTTTSNINDINLSKIDIENSIKSQLELLNQASLKKIDNTNEIVNSLLLLEKLQRQRNKLDNGKTSKETLEYLNGNWRLIFTTGTIDTQKKIGRINYFPLKAIQSFNILTNEISNGIYLGDFTLIKFFGQFQWIEKLRKVEFDFNIIQFLGIRFNLPSGGAAKIGQSTGLGSESNINLIKKNKKPFFNWISANENIATARGGGGGLALWRRVVND